MRRRQLQVRIVGGLGNQLFVYFAGLYLSQVSGRDLVLNMKDTSRVHSSFDLRSFREISKIRILNNGKPSNSNLSRIMDSLRYRFPEIATITDNIFGIYQDEGFERNQLRVKSKKRIIRISGYFQDFEYLENLGDIKLSLEFSEQDASRPNQQNTLAVHIRRGDFVNEKTTHGCLDTSWYKQAISLVLQTNPEIKSIRIFSNDTGWVKSNLGLTCPETNIQIEIVNFDPLQNPAVGFLEFSACTYRVCSNSTYSLLASRIVPGFTVVPYPYNRSENFKVLEDSSPQSWIRVPSIWEE